MTSYVDSHPLDIVHAERTSKEGTSIRRLSFLQKHSLTDYRVAIHYNDRMLCTHDLIRSSVLKSSFTSSSARPTNKPSRTAVESSNV